VDDGPGGGLFCLTNIPSPPRGLAICHLSRYTDTYPTTKHRGGRRGRVEAAAAHPEYFALNQPARHPQPSSPPADGGRGGDR